MLFIYFVEILNEQEFGEEKQYDENKINSASELGLLVGWAILLFINKILIFLLHFHQFEHLFMVRRKMTMKKR